MRPRDYKLNKLNTNEGPSEGPLYIHGDTTLKEISYVFLTIVTDFKWHRSSLLEVKDVLFNHIFV